MNDTKKNDQELTCLGVDIFDLARISEADHLGIPFPLGNFDDCDEEQKFLAWYDQLRGQNAFPNTKREVVKVLLSVESWNIGTLKLLDMASPRAWLVRQIFNSCWEAHKFRINGDPEIKTQSSYSHFEETREVIAALSRKLATRLSAVSNDPSHPLRLQLHFASKSLESRGLTQVRPSEWLDVIERLASIMEALPARYVVERRGCLFYADPIHSGKKASVETLLAFDLSYVFRWFTHDGLPLIRHTRMPRHGRPCWTAVAELVNLTIASQLSADSARDSVRKLVENSNPFRGPWEGKIRDY